MSRHTITLMLLFLLLASSLFAENLSGHVKYQGTIANHQSNELYDNFGPDPEYLNSFDIRINAKKQFDSINLVAESELLGLAGNGLSARRKIYSSLPGLSPTLLPDDQLRLFDLTTQINNDDQSISELRFDRLYLSYAEGNLVVNLGRQAVSWGNSLVFQVLDPINPFSPTAIDKEYKIGDDMLYAQWLFQDGGDLQVIGIPRRSPMSHELKDDQSSLGLKYHNLLSNIDADYDLFLAQHYDEVVWGLGISKSFLEAVWRVDYSATDIHQGNTVSSFVANVDRSWSIFGKNVYSFLEFFDNGFGTSDYEAIDQDLLNRIGRGELYTLAKNYIATGLRIEASPLINLFPSYILNLQDHSGILQLRTEYDWRSDVTFIAGLNLPYGDSGDEFGTFKLAPNVFLGPTQDIYLRAIYYF